jgi:Tfp pilus assembly protein PilE
VIPRRAGWTLVDLMIALALVGILTGIALPAVRVARTRARAMLVRSHIDQLRIRMQQVCQATGACEEPQDTTVYVTVTDGVTPAWIRDSLTAQQQFDQRASNGYLLEWVPVISAVTTVSRPLSNCQRCRFSDSTSCSSRPISERTMTIASYGTIAVIDDTPDQSDLGNQLAGAMDVTVQFQPTGRWPNRWLFNVDPIAVRTIMRDTTPTRNSTFQLTCN